MTSMKGMGTMGALTGGGNDQRQHDGEARARAWYAGHVDHASIGVHRRFNQAQPQAKAAGRAAMLATIK
jgi:hypothetical protein